MSIQPSLPSGSAAGRPVRSGTRARKHRLRCGEYSRRASRWVWSLPFLLIGIEVHAQVLISGTRFVYAEYVRTGGPVRYGLADTAVNARLGRIWVPDTAAFAPNRIINPVKMVQLQLIRPACSIETGSLNQDVSLGNYATSDLRNGTVTPGWQTFRLTMAACANPADLLTDITFGIASDADVTNANLFQMNATGPGGYGIAIETGDGALRMLPGRPREFAAVGAGASYTFRARLERTSGKVTAGRIQRPVAVLVTFR